MAELKTKKNDASIEDFLNAVEDVEKRTDSFVIHKMMQKITGDTGSMWGSSIVGYGKYHYKYASGREGDWMATGFSPRKNALSIYIMAGFKRYEELMKDLGKYKNGKGCLNVKRLSDVNLHVLEELIKESFDFISTKYPSS